MERIRAARPRLTYANVVATAALIAVVAGGAVAIGQSKTTTISACAKKKGGALRIVSAKAKCQKTERKVTWNQRGPAGAAGATGPAGRAGADTTAPSGAVAFFDLPSCPAGWAAFAPASGRYVVGLGAGGTLGKTVGTTLGDGEDRPTGRHDHPITDPGHIHQSGARTTITAGNVSPLSTQANGQSPGAGTFLSTLSATTGIVVNDSTGASGVGGTNAPYVQLLACRKD